jgi:hypothetical protein
MNDDRRKDASDGAPKDDARSVLDVFLPVNSGIQALRKALAPRERSYVGRFASQSISNGY